MAPSIVQPSVATHNIPIVTKGTKAPLQSSLSLDKFQKFDVTPVIGTEFKEGIQLADILSAPNSDDLIRDLAILGIYLSPSRSEPTSDCSVATQRRFLPQPEDKH